MESKPGSSGKSAPCKSQLSSASKVAAASDAGDASAAAFLASFSSSNSFFAFSCAFFAWYAHSAPYATTGGTINANSAISRPNEYGGDSVISVSAMTCSNRCDATSILFI